MFQFYEREGFRLFPCHLDKTPDCKSWRSSEAHIDAVEADRRASRGQYTGAWLPPHYVVIDVDRNHGTNPDGVPIFTDLCETLGVSIDTLTVKTGSGGQHLYFTIPRTVDYRTLSQKQIAESVDIRTHNGYVISAGTPGYTVTHNAPVQELPGPLIEAIQKKGASKARPYVPTKPLPIEILDKVLQKIPAEEFSNNDTWQEFVTSCIAVAGNSPEALDVIEQWSKSDRNYSSDQSIRKRLDTFEVEGGITAGTFIHCLKSAGVKKHIVDKVRMHIGAEFQVSASFVDAFDSPFTVDYGLIHEHKDLIRAVYYAKHQLAGAKLFAALAEESFMYVGDEKSFYHFDGSRWVESAGAVDDIAGVLINAAQRWYTDVSKKEDADAAEYMGSFINFLGSASTVQRLESLVKQNRLLYRKSIEWDADALQSTLTLSDCVMDFTGEEIEFRKGRKEEYRRRYIDLCESDFSEGGLPEHFRSFLKDVFPDEETRKTATYALSTMLSGTGKFRKFQIWNGSGSNGKSTLMEIMKSVIGERAISYKSEILLNKQHVQSLTPELATFRGALVAFASETEESKRVSQGSVKVLTGDETITANPKYKGIIQFKTTFQLVLATNYLPTFSAHDAAFIDRVIILPFYTCFYKGEEQRERSQRRGSRYFMEAKDPKGMMEAIKSERAKILYYLATRYMELDKDIPESPECRNAKGHYVDDNNDIFKFFEEFLEFSDEPDNGLPFWFTPSRDITNFYNEENNTRFSSKFVSMRIREVYPLVETASKKVDGKLTRGLKHVRITHGAYPEGYSGNYTEIERKKLDIQEAAF